MGPLQSQGQCVSDATGKSTILNHHYASVFRKENLANIPDKGPSPHLEMPELHIDDTGVLKLLTQINPHKTCAPDALPAGVLKDTTEQMAPVLTIIYREMGSVPTSWKDANITPVFEKGEKFKASN